MYKIMNRRLNMIPGSKGHAFHVNMKCGEIRRYHKVKYF